LPGSLSHLSRRFFDVLFARRLGPDEEAVVRARLSAAEAGLFFKQGKADQRHGFHAMSVVEQAHPEMVSAMRAGLLHDLAKRHARLGAIGRTLATVLIKLGLPITARMRAYRDHGEMAARELSELGAEDLVIDFARNHHGSRPESISPELWDLLQDADQPPKTWSMRRDGIS
jgi:putative nucleotidyltransferase with HDIG domain